MVIAEHPALVAAWLLVARMERLSADSHWAHRASGLRGALLRSLDEIEHCPPAERALLLPALEQLNQASFETLRRAAQEIRPPRPDPNRPSG